MFHLFAKKLPLGRFTRNFAWGVCRNSLSCQTRLILQPFIQLVRGAEFISVFQALDKSDYQASAPQALKKRLRSWLEKLVRPTSTSCKQVRINLSLTSTVRISIRLPWN